MTMNKKGVILRQVLSLDEEGVRGQNNLITLYGQYTFLEQSCKMYVHIPPNFNSPNRAFVILSTRAFLDTISAVIQRNYSKRYGRFRPQVSTGILGSFQNKKKKIHPWSLFHPCTFQNLSLLFVLIHSYINSTWSLRFLALIASLPTPAYLLPKRNKGHRGVLLAKKGHQVSAIPCSWDRR